MAVSTVAEVFQQMGDVFKKDAAAGVDAVFQFDLTGANGAKHWVKVQNQTYTHGEGESADASITIVADAADYIKIVNGEMAAMSAFMTGKLKVKGDMGLALKLQSMFPTG